jgi:hypothetical protein
MEQFEDKREELYEEKDEKRRQKRNVRFEEIEIDGEGLYDALDVTVPIFRDPPTLDALPKSTPIQRAQPTETRTSASLNYTPGPPRAAEPPRVQTQAAEDRIAARDAVLSKIRQYTLQRQELKVEYDNNSMALAKVANPVLRETIKAEQASLQSTLTALNKKLKDLNVRAEDLKKLTPEEHTVVQKKRKGGKVNPVGQEIQALQKEISDARKRLAQLQATIPQRRLSNDAGTAGMSSSTSMESVRSDQSNGSQDIE